MSAEGVKMRNGWCGDRAASEAGLVGVAVNTKSANSASCTGMRDLQENRVGGKTYNIVTFRLVASILRLFFHLGRLPLLALLVGLIRNAL